MVRTATNDLQILTRHEVTSIDRKNKKVLGVNSDSGEQFAIGYDKLLMATGAQAFVPQIPGRDLKNIHTMQTI